MKKELVELAIQTVTPTDFGRQQRYGVCFLFCCTECQKTYTQGQRFSEIISSTASLRTFFWEIGILFLLQVCGSQNTVPTGTLCCHSFYSILVPSFIQLLLLSVQMSTLTVRKANNSIVSIFTIMKIVLTSRIPEIQGPPFQDCSTISLQKL